MEPVLMRRFALLCTLFVGAVLASAQNDGHATSISVHAGNWEPPGVYALPNVPLVSTPSVSLDAAPVSVVGASDATAGNVSGATNSTLSVVSQPRNGPFAPLAWYGSGQQPFSRAGETR
jgi:hypothetical protein